jgi:hypothetical protein
LLNAVIFVQGIDATVIQTSLREMEEELGIPAEKAEVSKKNSFSPLTNCFSAWVV